MKNYHSRFKRRKTNEFTLGTAIDNWIEQLSLRERLRLEQVRAGWPEIVGTAVADQTDAIWMIDSILYVRIRTPQWKQEVSFARDRIKFEVNQFVNHPLCSDVQVR